MRPTAVPTAVPTTAIPTAVPTFIPTAVPTKLRCDTCTATGEYLYVPTLDSGTVSCEPCPVGYKCSLSGCSPPVACAVGKLQTKTNQTVCDSCPTGQFNNIEGSTACYDCPPGFSCSSPESQPEICDKGTFSKANFTNCITCDDGDYQDRVGSSVCLECPAGSFCSSSSKSSRKNSLLFILVSVLLFFSLLSVAIECPYSDPPNILFLFYCFFSSLSCD